MNLFKKLINLILLWNYQVGVLWVCWGGLERIKPALPHLVHACLSKALYLCSPASLTDGTNCLSFVGQHLQHSWEAFALLVVLLLLWCFPLSPTCQQQRPSHIWWSSMRGGVSHAPWLLLHQGLHCCICVCTLKTLGTEKKIHAEQTRSSSLGYYVNTTNTCKQ